MELIEGRSSAIIIHWMDIGNSSVAGQTSILSWQEKSGEDIDWHLSHTIRPTIKRMRIVELGGRLYSLKLCGDQWTFSSSTTIDLSTNVQFLNRPINLC